MANRVPRPSRTVLAAFLLVVLIGGSNIVAVRFSNRELPPFWGAGLRFAIAALLLFAVAGATRLSLPRGRALVATGAFGVLNFGLGYALAYWGLLEAPAALAATLIAFTPLLTFFMAILVGLERFRWGGLLGGAIAVAGVAVVFTDQLRATPPGSVLALLLTAVTIAMSTVVLKRLPRPDPIATNAVAMVPGAVFLLALSFLAREPAVLPTRADVWVALVYLVTVGSIGLFAGFVYVVKRWTASASSYITVLLPIVTVVIGAILAGELVGVQFVLGTLLVMAGVYVGALSTPATAAAVPPAPRASEASRS